MSEGAKRQKLQNDAIMMQKAMSEGVWGCSKRLKLQSDARHFQDDDALDDEEVGEVPKCRGCRQCECASCILQKQHLRQEEEDDDANLRPEHPLCDDCGECAGCRGGTLQASQVVQHTTDATTLPTTCPRVLTWLVHKIAPPRSVAFATGPKTFAFVRSAPRASVTTTARV